MSGNANGDNAGAAGGSDNTKIALKKGVYSGHDAGVEAHDSDSGSTSAVQLVLSSEKQRLGV